MGDAGREFVCLLPLKKETLERVGERTDTTQHTEALKGGQRVVGRFWRPLAGNLWGISGVGCGEAGGGQGKRHVRLDEDVHYATFCPTQDLNSLSASPSELDESGSVGV